jgi:protein TonB
MLPSQPQGSKRFRFAALGLAVVVNISLAGLIYGLTIGSHQPIVKEPVTINFRQFTDSSVQEKMLEEEVEITAKPKSEVSVSATLQPPQPSFSVQNRDITSSISLPAIAVPTFNANPELVSVALDIQPESILAPPQVNVIEQGALGQPEIGFAKVLRKVKPQYPYKAQRLKIEGHVLLHILIDDTGQVQEIKVIEEKPRGYFVRAVRKAIRREQFESAPQGTEVWKQRRVEFAFD